jgi:steroid 5-alpha reductase family enzyme
MAMAAWMKKNQLMRLYSNARDNGWQAGTMIELLGIGLAIVVPLFALVWALCIRIDNYGFLDAVWSLSIAILAPVYTLLAGGDPWRRAAFAAVGAAWSLRLGLYILIRVWRHHPHEDRRYRTLREKWPGPGRFLLFFELQAVIAVLFSLPFLLAALNPRPGLAPIEIAGLALASLGIAGESTADWQAQRFKSDPANKPGVVNVGLWRYSRHPNYFFESVVWWGFFVAALGSPHGAVTLICPLLMLYLLLNVTGIPLTEKHSLESRGAVYREYQRTTSRFVPWFPKASQR